MSILEILVYIVLPLGGIGGGFLLYRHQCLLKDRAQLMRDAMRLRDFSFRLPTKGLLFGEKALQEALNDTGQDIQKLVANNEVESWQRLTRVLTHEIMNATAPIQSISQAYLNNPQIKGTHYEEGIRAIYDTTKGLANFVDSYRKMTLLQEPVMEDVNIHSFLDSVVTLYPELTWKVDIPDTLTWKADSSLLRQVFINLVKNAVEADAKTIGVGWNGALLFSNDGHTIPDDVAREIFIPFFTTKSTGSGIGLSLSRQILMKQGLILTLREHPLRHFNVTFIIEGR